MTITAKPITGMTRTNQLLAICLVFLGLEERALLERRPHIARWARRMYKRYRDRLDRVWEPRSYRPARGLEPPEEVIP